MAAAACGKGGVKLVDFPETATENVELGDIYTITLKEVKDEEGNAYRVSASVKTKAGGAVSVFESQFNITDMEGYVITYTAEIDEKTEKTSVVTLNVTDNGRSRDRHIETFYGRSEQALYAPWHRGQRPFGKTRNDDGGGILPRWRN